MIANWHKRDRQNGFGSVGRARIGQLSVGRLRRERNLLRGEKVDAIVVVAGLVGVLIGGHWLATILFRDDENVVLIRVGAIRRCFTFGIATCGTFQKSEKLATPLRRRLEQFTAVFVVQTCVFLFNLMSKRMQL